MNQPVTVMISLAEAVGVLKQTFRDYTSMLIQARNTRVADLKGVLDYNCVPYLSQLLEEIFADQGVPEMVGGVSASTDILIRDGLERKIATAVAMQVFRSVIGEISAMLPEMRFGANHGCCFAMCSDYDMCITLPMRIAEEA